MFATLGGSLPIPPRASDDGRAEADGVDGPIRIVIAAQEAAGLEPITDGGLRHPDPMVALAAGIHGLEVRSGAPPLVRRSPEWRAPVFVDGWRFAASCTDRAVKQAIAGPFTLARHVAPGRLGRERVTLALAEALNAEIRALAAAGCPLIEVVEDGAVAIGDDPAERRLFREAQLRLTAGIDDVHLSLAIRGGSAYPAGAETIFAAPYASYLFDLCAGPDNWRLVVAAPGDRGIVVGAEDASLAKAEGPELHAFAIGYAASTGGRGHDRIGLATSGDMAGLTWAAAQAKMVTIGRTAALYAGPPGEPRRRDGSASGRHPERRPRSRCARSARSGAASVTLPEPRASGAWSVYFRVQYRLIRLLAPIIGPFWRGYGLGNVVELRVVGWHSGRPRPILLGLLRSGDHWFLGHPNGDVAWTRNLEAAGGGACRCRGRRRSPSAPPGCPTGSCATGDPRHVAAGVPRQHRLPAGPPPRPGGRYVLPHRDRAAGGRGGGRGNATGQTFARGLLGHLSTHPLTDRPAIGAQEDRERGLCGPK